ncbi:Cytochrome P450 3A11 like protein [Argiope bruennichi]|uniref:Cytochrome P450 3A11 like protein n=1 Tax=Argiope bruennichi TaxID=94029 RepID=A0A8T0G058_ARGBR|nr:Cytochrome P450 3A11 like protein [Argiope bruennichi]
MKTRIHHSIQFRALHKMLNLLYSIFPLFLTLCFWIYKLSGRNHDYFKKKGLPYVKPQPFLGSILDFLQKPGHEEELRRYREFGPVYGFFEGNKANLSIADPNILKEILVKKFHVFNGRRELFTGDIVVDNMLAVIRGNDWKRIRDIVTPTFTTSRIKNTMNVVKNCAETMIQNFRVYAEDGKYVNVKRIFGAFTMDVIAKSAFSTTIDSHNDPDNAFVNFAKRVLNMKMNAKFICFHVFPTFLMRLLRICITDVEATHGLKNRALEIMKTRKKNGQVCHDFLQILMDAAKENEESLNNGIGSTNSEENDRDNKLSNKDVPKRMTMDELASQSVAFFLAGYDTTASTLSFATYLLALNQSIQDKLRDEVDTVLEECNGKFSYYVIKNMKYMDNVLAETLRLYPPIYRLERQANADCRLDDSGIAIRKGMLVTVPVYAMNRDSKYWEDPETFNPDRFETTNKKNPYFLPFGSGPKNCVGMRFAEIEMKICLFYLMANFKIHSCPKTKVPIEFDKGLNGLLQPLDITLRLEIRENPPLIEFEDVQPKIFIRPLENSFIYGFVILIIIYWYSTRNHDYWKKKRIPYVKPLPLIGTVLDTMRKPLYEVECERYNELGPIYGYYEANNPVLTVGDPVLLKDILVKDFFSFTGRRIISTGDKVIDNMLTALRGEDWKRVRTIVTPTFTTGKLKRMLTIFKDCATTLMNNFKYLAKEGRPIDVKRIYGAFTMDVIASSAFSSKIDSHNDPDNRFVPAAKEVFNQKLGLRLLLFLIAPRLMKLLRISLFTSDATDFFRDITLQIIEERKRTGQLLMDTAKEIGKEEQKCEKETEDIVSNYEEHSAGHHIFKAMTMKSLSSDELVAQSVIFFTAGYDTTSSTLSFATYQLALNPDIQDTLREEVDLILQEKNGELTYEAIQKMKYLDNVISETLRLYPIVVKLERYSDTDYKLGDTGILIPKGMILSIPVIAMHRDPRLWPDPERFDPDRFTSEAKAKRDPYSYLPFGAGPRNCVGMRFALMQIKVCLALIIANFKINRCSETKVPLEFHLGQQGVLQPKEIVVSMEIKEDSFLNR